MSKKWMLKFEKILQQNVAYNMENPTLDMQVSSSKYVENQYKLGLHFTVKVIHCKLYEN